MKRLFPILSILVLLVTSCNVEPVSVQQSQSQPVNPVVVEPTFMSGTLNGLQYDNLKPLTYYNSSSFQTAKETYIHQGNSYNYLLLQGSDITLNDNPNAQSIVINIRIPQSQWNVGTYDLKDIESVVMNNTNSCIDLVAIGAGKKAKSVSGTMSVTEFNTTTHVVKGNFSFTYYLENEVGDLEGPYNFTNGQFKYSLDDPYFN